MVFTKHETRNTNHGLFVAYFDRRLVSNAGWQPVSKVPWMARRAPVVARRGVRRMAIRVISSDERQSRRPQTSVARRVTRRFRSAARRACHCVTAAGMRYAIRPGARNAACVTFATGCYAFTGAQGYYKPEPTALPKSSRSFSERNAKIFSTSLATKRRLTSEPPGKA